MKVIVTGGRDFHDFNFVNKILQELHASNVLTHVIHGNASGTDQLAGTWARQNGVQEVVCPADWKRFGRPAGPMRNAAMLELLGGTRDIVVAFPGFKGTHDMVTKAKAAGVAVQHYKPN